jgi:hypothetical protein
VLSPVAREVRRRVELDADGELAEAATASGPGAGWRVSNAVAGRRGRHVTFDTNKWKTFVAERLRTPAGAAGCLSLFARGPPGRAPDVRRPLHRRVPGRGQAPGRRDEVDEWKDRPGRDNHLWDCLVGCAVAASLQGLRWDSGTAAGAPPPAKKPKKKVDIEELYRGAPTRSSSSC